MTAKQKIPKDCPGTIPYAAAMLNGTNVFYIFKNRVLHNLNTNSVLALKTIVSSVRTYEYEYHSKQNRARGKLAQFFWKALHHKF